jgi:lipoprotein-anchoring transpeptidase ErfK/SrfK
MLQRRKVIIGALGVAGGLTVAGCSSKGGSKTALTAGTWQAPASGGPTLESAAAVTLTVSPAAGADKVSPTEPVVVSVAGGKLQSVTVAAGKTTLHGDVQDDGVSWKSSGTLAYGQTYKVTASILDSTGAAVEKTSDFTTLKPKATTGVTFQANGMNALHTGGTYGIGQPVIVAFSKAVHDKAAAEKAIDIETSPSVEGKFYWASSSIVHWRPAKYWAKGTTVKVSVKGLGTNFGNGVYGSKDASTHFTIGRSLLAISDNNAHRTRVYIDGKMVRDMACSNGRGGYTTTKDGSKVNFWTANGPHVVLSKEATHSMSSASYGVTNPKDPFYYAPEVVKLCTRISYSGEFLHAAPWNHALGRANLSHGCINLSESDAKWVYDNFLIGDVVEVRNSPKELPIWNGLGDWTVSFDKYGH